MLDEFASMGLGALESLSRQRSSLKEAQRKVLDIGNSLGLSSSLLRLIERTETFNACIVAAGMLTTCAVVAAVWYFYL